MNFQFLIVLSLACASSAQYYYTRPLSGYGSYQTGAPMVAGPRLDSKLTEKTMMTMEEHKMKNTLNTKPRFESSLAGQKLEASMNAAQKLEGSMNAGQKLEASMKVSQKVATTTERVLTTEENPCTAEVLRSTEIQAFKDPLSASSYIVCTDIDVFVRMPCATGTVFNSEIKHCVPKGWVKPVCPVGLCKNHGDCIIDEIKNEYKCLCRVGFTGLFCETNIDECALEGNQICAKAGGRCVDSINAWYCDFGLTIGFTTAEAIEKPCTLKDLAEERQFFEIPSVSRNVYLQCTGESRWRVSRCADMLFWNQELKTCSIEKPIMKTGICKTFPCKNDGVCEDLGDFNFKCTCAPGYTGALCEDLIDLCLESPCGAGRCVAYPGGYNCLCANKIVDKSCEMTLMNPCREVSEHHPHSMTSEKYLSCGLDGLAFVKSCAPSTTWDNRQQACIAPFIPIVAPRPPKMSIFDRPTIRLTETMPVETGSMSGSTSGSMTMPVKTGSISGSMTMPVRTGSMSGSTSGSMTMPVRTGSMSGSMTMPVKAGLMSGSMHKSMSKNTVKYPGY